MKRVLVLGASIAGVTILFVGGVMIQQRRNAPEALLARLERGEGNAENLIMRLNLATEDTVPAMLAALRKTEADAAFRATVLELLFRKYHRDADSRVEPALYDALRDGAAAVRRQAVTGFGLYFPPRKQAPVAGLIDDPDLGVRRQVFLLLTEQRRNGSLWDALSDEARARVVQSAKTRMQTETHPDLRLLAASVIGREVDRLCNEARQATGRSDLDKAKALLEQAQALDPESLYARIRLVRYHLRVGEREKGLELAESFGALLRVPRLSAAPTVDGDPTDSVWEEALAKEEGFYRSTSRWVARHTEGRTAAYLGHRDQVLYIAVRGFEPDLDKLVIQHHNRDSDVWQDDCVEIFLDPGNTEKNVYQFVVNAAGALFDLYNQKKRENFKAEVAARIFRDRGYWGCEFAIAARELKENVLTPESLWGFNLYRTRIGGASECCAWWPPYGFNHRYHLFPLMVFEDVEPPPKAEPAAGE